MAHEASHSVTVDALRSLAVFADLPNSELDQLLRASQVRQLDHRQRLSALARDQGESYCFVLSGVVSVALDREGTAAPAREDRLLEHIGFFAPGDLFSDGFLDCPPGTGAPVLDCMASTSATLLAASRPALAETMARNAVWSTRLRQKIAASRNYFLSQQEPTGAMPDGILLVEGAELKYINQIPHTDHCVWLPVCLQPYLDETNDYAILREQVMDREGHRRTVFERITDAMRWLLQARDHVVHRCIAPARGPLPATLKGRFQATFF